MDDLGYFRIALENILKEKGRGAQCNLALDAHVSEAYISQIITEKRKDPSRKTLSKICSALKTTEAEMIEMGKRLSEEAGFSSSSPKARSPSEASLYQFTLQQLAKRIDDQSETIKALNKRIDSLQAEIATVDHALRQCEHAKDFLPLKISAGTS